MATHDSSVVLVDGARTPHGALLGSLADVDAVELARTALDGLFEGIDGETVDWACLGNAIQAGIGQVPARQAVIRSSLPDETPTTTVNEASGSGLRAITLAADRIRADRADVVVAGGFESMTNAPWILPDYRKGRRYGDATVRDSMILDALWDVTLDVHMGEITERFVDREGISREAQDRYALESHRRAAETIESGGFDGETVPLETADGRRARRRAPSRLRALGARRAPGRSGRRGASPPEAPRSSATAREPSCWPTPSTRCSRRTASTSRTRRLLDQRGVRRPVGVRDGAARPSATG